VITAIDYDHMDFLGNSRESIGFEKAGIFRKDVPAICGDPDPPHTLTSHAHNIDAQLRRIGHDFCVEKGQLGWTYLTGTFELADLPVPSLTGGFQLENAACVVDVIQAMQKRLPVSRDHIALGLKSVQLPGRFQQCSTEPLLILDVAHNPHAAHALAQNLQQLPKSNRTLAVFGMLADKDITGVVQEVIAQVDTWYLADIPGPRGATAQQVARIIHQHDQQCDIRKYPDVSKAYRQACLDAGRNDRIIVFGSFYTVADVMRDLSKS
jgi:dihydrofolate synthase/folylpolyglutamate synthase